MFDFLRKNSPDAGDVHVDAPMGSKKKKKKGAKSVMQKASNGRTLYAYRPVLNAEKIIEHFKAQGVATLLEPDDMHITIAYSKDELVWDRDHFYYKDNVTLTPGPRAVSVFGDAAVLEVSAPELIQEWLEFIYHGATYSFPSYRPHITLSYTIGADQAATLVPFPDAITLGPMQLQEVNPPDEVLEKFAANWSTDPTQPMSTLAVNVNKGSSSCHNIVKVDKEQRIVWGWASVVMEKGELIVDRQGHRIEPSEMEKAANDFMADVRLAKAMHDGAGVGEVIHSFVVTDEICKAFDIECDRRGWIIAMKIHDDDTWEMVKSGQLQAFSIGGRGVLTDA